MTHQRTSAKRKARRQTPDAVKVRSARRERWTGGREGSGFYLPIAEELTEADLPRLERAAAKQMERNRAWLNRNLA